ncbi:MAG: RNA polymerase sigma factor [Pirellulaceae bacterium]
MIDSETFAAHYCQVYPRMHLIATGMIGDRTHAHDIVQEAAIIALKKSDQFIPNSNFSAWLAEIVRRCALNYVRKMRTRRTTATDPDLLAKTQQTPPASWLCGPIHEKTGTLIEFQEDFDDATLQSLGKLNHEPRCCLLLRVVQNLSYTEISRLLQIPEGTAMSHVHRSKRALRQTLSRDTIRSATPGEEP